MCCQMTPAIGQLAMKPITTIFFRFMPEKSVRSSSPGSSGRHRAAARFSQLLDDNGRITRDHHVGWNVFTHHRAGRDDGVFADGHAFELSLIHISEPTRL